MLTSIALLHSPLVSAATWGNVPNELAARGLDVVVPEVLDDDEPPFAARYVARASLQLAQERSGEPLVLVGHSGAGPLLPQIGFARHAAGVPVRGYVFLDAMLPRVGNATTRLELMSLEDASFASSLADELSQGGRFPDWSEADLAESLPDPADRALVLAGLRPRQLDFFTEPLPVPEDWPDARCAYIKLSAAYDKPAATAARRGWDVRSADLHHFGALTHPTAVVELLLQTLGDL